MNRVQHINTPQSKGQLMAMPRNNAKNQITVILTAGCISKIEIKRSFCYVSWTIISKVEMHGNSFGG